MVIADRKSNRIGYLDLFRGIGILIMVMGHVGFGNAFSHFYHAFHMPMWFFVSGYLFSKKPRHQLSDRAYITKRFRSLMVPYFSFGLLFFAVWSVVHIRQWEPDDLIHLLFVNTNHLAYADALWFLTALFFADCIYFLIRKHVPHGIPEHTAVVLLALFGNVAVKILPFRLPWALDAALVGVGLMHIGFLFGTHEENKTVHFVLNMNWTAIAAAAVLSAALIFLNGAINMRNGYYAILPLFWFNATCACLIGFSVCKKICEWRWFSRAKQYFCSVGENSLVSLCLNQPIILILGVHLGMKAWGFPVSSMAILILTMVLLWFAAELLLKTKLRFLLGK